MTSWATVWDTESGKKYSLARPDLYPEHAVVDPQLMLGKPRQLTISTGLDALSHALESLWNVNANPLSAHHAVAAAREILVVLPRLRKICRISSCEPHGAGSAFGRPRLLEHAHRHRAFDLLSAHASSWCRARHRMFLHLPMILRSVSDLEGSRAKGWRRSSGRTSPEPATGSKTSCSDLGVSTDFRSYGVAPDAWSRLILDAFDGERGQNFVGRGKR